MKSADRLKLVLEKMIVPHYNEISGVDVKVFGALEVYFYEVTYFYSKDMMPDKFVMRDIMRKTVSLFKMLGVDRSSDINVLFVEKK